MVILGIALLGLQAAMTDRLINDVGLQDRRTVALQLAADRLGSVQADPVYGELERRYAGTETEVEDFRGYRRETDIRRTSRDGVDYKTVTVTVSHRLLREPVSRTLVIAAP